MRFIPFAALMLVLGAPLAWAGCDDTNPDQITTRVEDHCWHPQSANTNVSPGAPSANLGSPSESTGHQLPYKPGPTAPQAQTATWKWDEQVCITTATGYGRDAVQWQVCEGTGCPMAGRGCYSVWTGAYGGYSNPKGSVATSCYQTMTVFNPQLCYR